jgi:hypothetical protein
MSLTPCLICEKAVVYYAPTTQTLAKASYLAIVSAYGSNFEGHSYGALICDECLDHAIQSKKVTLK